jgi:hypothetical protein
LTADEAEGDGGLAAAAVTADCYGYAVEIVHGFCYGREEREGQRLREVRFAGQSERCREQFEGS